MVNVQYEVGGVEVAAQTKPDLFSPKSLDQGTRLLLDSVASKVPYTKALDWGCGWGAISLWLAKNAPLSKVLAIDSDIAATATTEENALANGIANLRVIPSHSFSALKQDETFDLICSNPPTHRGREIVDSMIAESFARLVDNGRLLLVVEARIKPWVAREMTKVFGSYKILKRGPKNVVLMSVKG